MASKGVAFLTCYGGCRSKSEVQCTEDNGYTQGDHLSYLCAACDQAGRKDHFAATCPALYLSTDSSRLAPDKLAAAMHWQFGSKGLCLVGPTGTGKTRIAWRVIERALLASKRALKFRWFDCVSFGHDISKHYREEDCEKWLEDTANVDLVFFDDLGKLKMTERAETELFGLVERRCANMLPIIATTNDTGDTLAARMTDNRGPALIRRLREFCDVITFP